VCCLCLSLSQDLSFPQTVKALLAAGAIPFVKTNLPQAMLGFECSNPLWGRTTHPLSSAYTCGGSSGGEAALLAASGSALGFGSDLACSIRTPASFCGLYALKPGHGRVSHGGALGEAASFPSFLFNLIIKFLVGNPGFEGVPAVVGPMGR
jgi:Asp-tRNA(Asn)/Glu-tRNA(Gln) amidotransferase A subunit family amidase